MNEQMVDFLVAPLTPAVGGLVSGVDLSNPLSQRVVEGLRAALAERHVLFFENQDLGPHDQRDFAARFGDLHVHPLYPHVDGVPEITLIETRPDYLPDNDNWHTDVTFFETPPFGAVLTPRVLRRLAAATRSGRPPSQRVPRVIGAAASIARRALPRSTTSKKLFHAIAGV